MLYDYRETNASSFWKGLMYWRSYYRISITNFLLRSDRSTSSFPLVSLMTLIQTTNDTSSSLSITTKAHLVFEHLEEVCEFYGVGMALLNESAAESVHADFDRHYQGYIVKDITSDTYRERLLHAVKTYNSGHL